MSSNETVVRDKKSKFKMARRISMIAIAVIIGICVFINILDRPYDRTVATFTNVTVEKGDTTSSVAEKLEEKGLIGKSSDFRLYCKLMKYNGKFKTGNYYLSPSMNKSQIAKTMTNGITTSTGYTLPAGYTVTQVADALSQAGYVNRKKFIDVASEEDFSYFKFIDSSTKGINNLEGFLMPGDYEVIEGADEVTLITIMLNEFDNFWNEENQAKAKKLGMSVRDIVTIASMIEEETTVNKEKNKLASVIYNRLDQGLAFTEYKGGFPSGPLCSPSRESIEAALEPAETDYLYCVNSDKLNGTHVFTSDETEYETYKAAYQAALKERNSNKE